MAADAAAITGTGRAVEYISARPDTHTHTQMHTQTHTHAHAHAHTHTHTAYISSPTPHTLVA